MRYTQQQLYDFMASERPVKVISATGKVYTGLCYAYSSATNEEEFGVDAPSLEVQDTALYSYEIQRIEYMTPTDT